MCRASVLVTTAVCLLGIPKPVSPFFLPSKVASLNFQLQRTARGGHFCQTHHDHVLAAAGALRGRKLAQRASKTTEGITMERARGKFKSLAKPKFDRNNPNAVLGEIEVPGLEQVSYLWLP